ncbi:MAG: phosphosulfolactate synthase [Bacteroidota bacterium]
MLNYPLNQLPDRTHKPRTSGLTMIMDKGLSVREAEDFLSVAASHADIIKLGWATSAVTDNLEAKLDVYRAAGIPFYLGGTLLEAFYIRGQIDEYLRVLDKYKIGHLEVSDGSIDISETEKCQLISRLAQNFTVLSEVGSKNPDKVLRPSQWIEMMQRELDAGSWKVIAEARESGTVGMFRGDSSIRGDLIGEILDVISPESVLWEAPQKSQQVWFIKLLGTNVNLGNIAPVDAIPLETLRLGLRGDTFHTFMNQ